MIETEIEEIRDELVEMLERLDGAWHAREDDEVLRKCFCAITRFGCSE